MSKKFIIICSELDEEDEDDLDARGRRHTADGGEDYADYYWNAEDEFRRGQDEQKRRQDDVYTEEDEYRGLDEYREEDEFRGMDEFREDSGSNERNREAEFKKNIIKFL